jgi:hypothetical protein
MRARDGSVPALETRTIASRRDQKNLKQIQQIFQVSHGGDAPFRESEFMASFIFLERT